MFDNNTSDDSTEYEYVVLLNGEEYDIFLDEEEAEDVADDLQYDYPFAAIDVRPQELGTSGYYSPDEVGGDSNEREFYPFIASATTVDEFTPGFAETRWGLGDHISRGEYDFTQMIEAAGDVNPELAGILSEAGQMVERASVSGFECPVCGLNHSHSDTKHDIRSAFDVTERFADWMEFCPYCHCGVNELAMLMDFFGYIDAPVFADESDFGFVNTLSNVALQGILRAVRDASSGTTFKSAVRSSSYGTDISGDDLDALEAFYRRYNSIKNAASNAPISTETRQEIEDLRADIEDAI